MRISDWSSDVCSSELFTLFSDIGTRTHKVAFVGAAAALHKFIAPKNRARAVERVDCALDLGGNRAIEKLGQVGARCFPFVHGHECMGRPADDVFFAKAGHLFAQAVETQDIEVVRSEEHTSELQSLMRSSYAVFC